MNPLEGLEPLQAIFVAEQYISKKEYHNAMAFLLAILSSSVEITEENDYVIKRAARLYAELNGALPETDPKRQAAAAVQLLVFSRVKPNEWLGTQGIAATILGRESSVIGNVEMNYQTGDPMLLQGDDYCVACHKVGCTQHCPKCKNAFYCDRECQVSDWTMHKMTCATSRARGVIKWNSTKPYKTELENVRSVIAKSLKKN